MITTKVKNSIVSGLVGRNNIFGSTVYVGFSSTEPNEDGTGVTEPVGNGYERKMIGNDYQTLTQLFGTPENGVITNSEIIYMNESTGPWLDGAPLTHFVLFDSKTSNEPSAVLGFDMLKDGDAPSPITVDSDKKVVMFRAGALTIKCVDADAVSSNAENN